METSTTNGITVSVETQYLPSHSNPREGKFIFGYHITIVNRSSFTVQLLRRHWVITNADGIMREVEGSGYGAWNVPVRVSPPGITAQARACSAAEAGVRSR